MYLKYIPKAEKNQTAKSKIEAPYQYKPIPTPTSKLNLLVEKHRFYLDEQGWSHLDFWDDGIGQTEKDLKHYRLHPMHVKELAESGITAEIAMMSGIHTVGAEELLKYGYWAGPEYYVGNRKYSDEGTDLAEYARKNAKTDVTLTSEEDPKNFEHDRLYLVYEYYDPWGQPMEWTCPIRNKSYPYARVRMPNGHRNRKNGQKYHQPKGSPTMLYIPSLIQRDYQEILGLDELGAIQYPKNSDLRVTEGEKKTLCSLLHTGMLTVGLPGVWCFQRVEYLLDFIIRASRIQVCFDNDIWSNQKIAKAADAFGDWAKNSLKLILFKDYIEGVKSKSEKMIQTYAEMQDEFDGLYESQVSAEIWPRFTAQKYAQVISNFSYTLLPISLKMDPKKGELEKLGIDDWLITRQTLGTDIAEKILGTFLPMFRKEERLSVKMNPWIERSISRKLSLVVSDYTYNWTKNKWEELDKKPTELTLDPIPKEIGREMCSLLTLATANMGKAMVKKGKAQGFGWDESKEIWKDALPRQFNSDLLAIAMHKYNFYDGNCGIHQMINRHSTHYLARDFEPGDFIGIADADVHVLTGERRPIDPDNLVFARSMYTMRSGKPKRYLESVTEMLGENKVDLFRAMIRVNYTPSGYRRTQFFPAIIGKPGCGKTSMMEVIKEVLPGCKAVNLSQLWNNTAMAGYVPMSWYGQRIIYDTDLKVDRALQPNVIQLFNEMVDGTELPFRIMGQQATDMRATFGSPWIMANDLPKISSKDSGGFYRRFLPINCKNGKRENAQEDWVTQICKEEGNQILNWIFEMTLEQAEAIIQKALKDPERIAIMETIKETENEQVLDWLDELYDQLYAADDNFNVNNQPLRQEDVYSGKETAEGEVWADLNKVYDGYRRYCKFNDLKPHGKNNFKKILEKFGGKIPLDSRNRVQQRMVKGARLHPIMLPPDRRGPIPEEEKVDSES